ncbi:DUF2637 domain-containing protein [Bifidobacterium tibiigranuli]|jgi:hypothetical protein|uniref:DUF2637 domain-containing protein n=1 Tax=Bifidobacterium tibiigranuli TaxID=2172043 RepID=UPI00235484AA|nr:DUF2637 domain-containing protein [Bifidobacterium tibiigranuli]MCH3973640.1 DUF2637 domain-containing protein [Bifidobacterium tibiigranuli]
MSETLGRRWAARTAIAGTCLIAFGAFWLSFTALADLADRSGIASGQAWAWPLIVDGIIVVATVSVVALAGRRSAWYPWMLLGGRALISVTANAVHAVVSADTGVPSMLAAAVAAVPPIVLLAITHLTVILTRTPDEPTDSPRVAVHQRSASGDAPSPTPEIVPGEHMPELGQAPSGNVPTADDLPAVEPAAGEPPSDRREQARRLREAGWSNKRIARNLGVHASTVGRWFTAKRPSNITESEKSGDES